VEISRFLSHLAVDSIAAAGACAAPSIKAEDQR
jgi:hypothetical protein